LTATDVDAIASRSYLREHVVTFSDSSFYGKTFRFRIKSENEIGETLSVINS
jgi:hypothetical protein